MKKNYAFLAVALLSTAASHAAVIFSDTFSSTGDLNGKAPNTRPGTETWSARTTAPATTVASAGLLSVSEATTTFLSWSPTAGNIYSLSVGTRSNTTNTTSSAFAGLGFFNSTNTTSSYNNSGPNTPWAFIRTANQTAGNIGDVDVRSTGNNGIAGDTNLIVTNTQKLDLILNTNDTDAGTAGTQFSLMFLVNNIQIGATQFYTAAESTALLTNITTVGLTGSTATNPVLYSNFMLQTIPEPSAALLGALGALTLLRRRR